jgi:hypothetical protein
MMKQDDSKTHFAVCVNNEGYAASLELRKIYRVLIDDQAAEHHLIRVVDESGEDYLYPEDYFFSIELSQTLEQRLSTIADPVFQASA